MPRTAAGRKSHSSQPTQLDLMLDGMRDLTAVKDGQRVEGGTRPADGTASAGRGPGSGAASGHAPRFGVAR